MPLWVRWWRTGWDVYASVTVHNFVYDFCCELQSINSDMNIALVWRQKPLCDYRWCVRHVDADSTVYSADQQIPIPQFDSFFFYLFFFFQILHLHEWALYQNGQKQWKGSAQLSSVQGGQNILLAFIPIACRATTTTHPPLVCILHDFSRIRASQCIAVDGNIHSTHERDGNATNKNGR